MSASGNSQISNVYEPRNVRIQGGTIQGVSISGSPIGATAASSANFTTVAASTQITSTVTGVAPLVVSSTVAVNNLNVGGNQSNITGLSTLSSLSVSGSIAVGGALTAGQAGFNGAAAQPKYSLGAAATSTDGTALLANNLRSALIAWGIGST